ncbi:piwi domain-containing protein [Hirsutella rhossiliensis]|uniref:Piwi domain-containing protein n=1 Tax=Hirsutella rhossiliensis TaxID=111463 RepID=A0A9P8SM95_9HYPO|nr:piwi domain-containing protein [Hirsutella rhossiliensis]KAH0966605.1 piwi domain-containing protein [Hirsutella rhossiliensis]
MLSAHLIDAFKSRLELWQKYNQGTLPDNIVIFRDGACRAKYPAKASPPRLTIVVSATAANELESLTYELCYLYGRAIKAVSICPPAYYADIVCERARAYRPEIFEVHETLKDTIYYI